jgi:hypothetical protein
MAPPFVALFKENQHSNTHALFWSRKIAPPLVSATFPSKVQEMLSSETAPLKIAPPFHRERKKLICNSFFSLHTSSALFLSNVLSSA